MTTKQIISELDKHASIAPFKSIRVAHIEVYRGQELAGNWSVSSGNTQLGGGRIPASADPETFPLEMAKAIVMQMKP